MNFPVKAPLSFHSRKQQRQLSISRETDCMLYAGSTYVLSYCPLTLQRHHDLTQKSPARAREDCYTIFILLVYAMNCPQVLLSSTKRKILFFLNWIPQYSPPDSLPGSVPVACLTGEGEGKGRRGVSNRKDGTNPHHLPTFLGPSQYPPSCKDGFGASWLSPASVAGLLWIWGSKEEKSYHYYIVNFPDFSS